MCLQLFMFSLVKVYNLLLIMVPLDALLSVLLVPVEDKYEKLYLWHDQQKLFIFFSLIF